MNNLAAKGDLEVSVDPATMIQMIANAYAKDPVGVILELVQNIMDSGATKAQIRIDFSRKKGKIIACDNGDGTTIGEMRDRLKNIGIGFKKDKRLIGEKNLGNLSPLGISNHHSLTSRPKREDPKAPFFTVTFDMSQNRKGEAVFFKYEIHSGKKAGSLNRTGWTTITTTKEIQPSAARSFGKASEALERICNKISTTYREKLKESGIQIEICVVGQDKIERKKIVKPHEYVGQKEVVEYDTPLGKVGFEMYFSPKPQSNPEILVDHQGRYQISLKEFGDIWKEVSDVFRHGNIQGTIHVDFCELLDDRSGFKWNEGREYLQKAIIQFTEEYGRPWIEEMGETKALDRFEQVASRVVKSFKEFTLIKDLIEEGLLLGAVSPGHKKADKGKAIEGKIFSQERVPGKSSEEPTREVLVGTGKEHKKRSHDGVSSSRRGSPRRQVGKQGGLQIVSDSWMGERAKLEKGRILINLTHPDYLEADRQSKADSASAALDTYVRLLIMGMITSLNAISSDRGDIFWEEFENNFMTLAPVITPVLPKGAGGRKRKR